MPEAVQEKNKAIYLKVSMFCSINVTPRPPSDTGLQTAFSTVPTSLPGGMVSSIL
jgi:hypothetical protein